MATDNRPLSPHLQIYRRQLTSVMSISHRLSGVVLSAGTVIVVLWLLALAAGPESHERMIGVLGHPVGLAMMVVWTFALLYHLLNGIRHLIWDAGWMLEIREAYAAGWTVLALAAVLTALIWGVLA